MDNSDSSVDRIDSSVSFVDRVSDLVAHWKSEWNGYSLPRKVLPTVGASSYCLILQAMDGLRGDHLLIGFILVALYYADPFAKRVRHFALPFLLTAMIYDSQRFYSDYIRGTVHVEFPYRFDQTYFGVSTSDGILTLNEWWQHHLHPTLDLITGFAYLVFALQYIFVSAYFGFWLPWREKNRRDLAKARQMPWAFFWLNILGYSTYYWFPAAPPWYVELYGLGPARLDTPANPAGCLRFDQILGTSFFSEMYGRSADVFGAIPSLHVAYPLLATYYAFLFKELRVLCVCFYLLMCFSAVYLNHHYVLDVLWGSAYALLVGILMERISISKLTSPLLARRSVLVGIALSLLLSSGGTVQAGECFDFSKKVTEPLKEPIVLNETIDTSISGQTQSGVRWGSARGVVRKPIASAIERLLDPKTIKGPENRGVSIEKMQRPGYFAFRSVEMTVRPFLFISISWKEEWAYSLLRGTDAAPERILISYQKTEGTSHIERFCGSILVSKIDQNRTDLFFYEEIKAARRSPEDIIRGHIRTLESLRK